MYTILVILTVGYQESPQSSSFWSFGRSAFDYIPALGTYQLATKSRTPNQKDDDNIVESPFKQDEVRLQPFKRQLCKMVKHTQTFRRLLPAKYLSVTDHFVVWCLIG